MLLFDAVVVRLASISRRLLGWALIALVWAGACAGARADDLTDFEKARALYEKRNYAGAVAAFVAMVGSDPPRVSERLLLLESRKYLAASLLFQGRPEEARAQFRLLLTQEPDYTIDPLAFPKDVVTLFMRVKTEVQAELREAREAETKAREEELRKQQEAAATEQANLQSLLKLAGEAETERTNSRWIAAIPFGVGQFQNGHKNFGVALAVLEGVAAVTSVATYLGHQQIAESQPAREDVGETERLEALWRNTNIVSFSAFVALAVIGIVDAQVRFVPSRKSARTRPLPPELEHWARERKLSFTGLGLRF